ncbi:MAG: hypothetical protein NHG36_12730 [Chromatiaceae bacterium]|jgi:hypothetical protein|nr:hypothetical protein [Candidatus Thioaporhodococcus sediminis]
MKSLGRIWLLGLLLGLGLFLIWEAQEAARLQALRPLVSQFQVLGPDRSQLPDLTLGSTSLGALAEWGPPPSLGLFQGSDGSAGVEAILDLDRPPYLGTLLLVLDPAPEVLDALEGERLEGRTLANGYRRYVLAESARPKLAPAPVVELAFVPRTRQRPGLWRQLFGEPADVWQPSRGQEYWLYPRRGLVISLAKGGSQWLHFVTLQRWGELLKRIQPASES